MIASFSRILAAFSLVIVLTGYAQSLFAVTVDSPGLVVEGLTVEADQLEVLEDAADARGLEDPTCGPRIPISESVFRQTYRVTAYCDRGLTAAGVPSGYGQCAAPADIPFGSRIFVPEIGQYFIVTDRTHQRFRHNTIDLFIHSRADCLQFGRRTLTCEVELPPQPISYGSPLLTDLIARRWP